MTAFAEYSTITLTNASTSVTITGGSLTTDGVVAGDVLIVFTAAGVTATLGVASVTNDTTLVLSRAWDGSTASGLTGYFFHNYGSTVAAENQRLLNEYIRSLQSLGANFDFVDEGVPDDGDGTVGQTYLNITNGDVYVKGASTWGSAVGSLQGPQGDQGDQGEKGDQGSLTHKGTYNGATAYALDDVVESDGSSWAALQATTGNAPPTLPTTSNAYWTLVVKAGADGADGADGANGLGVPSGGTAGQVLAKASATDNDTEWVFAGPIGQVSFFAMNTAPDGWLKANGAAISRTTYADLFAAIGTTFGVGDGSTTFNLPDLRGEFLRAWDDARGIDSGRSFGTFQDHAVQDHTHSGGGSGTFLAPSGAFYGLTSPNSTGGMATGNSSTETRPRNIALLACIKY